MSFVAFVETDNSDPLRVRHSDGRLGGNALVTFLVPLSAYCSGIKVPSEVQQWFSKFEVEAKGEICILAEAFYGGKWDYNEDEYEKFLRESPELPLTQEEFKKTIREVMQKWADIQRLLTSVNKLISMFERANLDASPWYDPKWTMNDFQALAQTLSLAVERGAKRARIKSV
jgi:hypothetical protein